jgi:hypothetical protein
MDVAKNVASMNLIKNKPEEDSDFLEAKETSIQCPRRCHRCSDCSDCSVSAKHLTSRKEQAELILLEQHMCVDHDLKCMKEILPRHKTLHGKDIQRRMCRLGRSQKLHLTPPCTQARLLIHSSSYREQ